LYSEAFGVKSLTQAIDFSKEEEVSWRALEAQLDNLDIGVLGMSSVTPDRINDKPFIVNNVGKSHAMPVDFVETPDQELRDILQININSTLRITKIVLPKLLEKYDTQFYILLNV